MSLNTCDEFQFNALIIKFKLLLLASGSHFTLTSKPYVMAVGFDKFDDIFNFCSVCTLEMFIATRSLKTF